jgi:uncharacterized protein involved in exopolysaccharide biosynthesis
MSDTLDAFEFASYVRRNWRVPVFAILTAILLAAAVSLLSPNRYTATATIIIDPPGMSDTRTATSVSPVYLESLKSYERFASSDSLFARAVEKFHLQPSSGKPPIESLQKRVLKVSKLRDTKILEISITLTDPVLAQKCAQFLAEQTISLAHEASAASDLELVEGASGEFAKAQERLDLARKLMAGASAGEPMESLQGEIDTDLELVAKLRTELSEAIGDVAAEGANQTARPRLDALNKQIAEVQRDFTTKSTALSISTARRQQAQTELESAQSIYTAAFTRLNDLRAAAGTRGERLRIIDPGIVPQRPSSPNIPLNVLVSFLAAILAVLIYSAVGFAREHREIDRFSVSVASRR